MSGYQGQQKLVSQKGGFSGQSSGTVQSHRSGHRGSTFPHRHSSGTTTTCSVCGRFHSGTCFNDVRECFQCGQKGHIKKNFLVPTTQPSSSHASAPAALASSHTPAAPV